MEGKFLELEPSVSCLIATVRRVFYISWYSSSLSHFYHALSSLLTYHADDVAYYFPTTPPAGNSAYHNPAIAAAFSQSFMNVVLGLDPNAKFDRANLTPHWDTWSSNTTEMMFNRTAINKPDTREIQTHPTMLKRCACVLDPLL